MASATVCLLLAAVLLIIIQTSSAACPSVYPGAWVKDASRPAYDSSCPFIGSTNCLMQGGRPQDWMGYSWKPASCAANALRFRPYQFLTKMRNKVFASVGESLSHAGFVPSLLCQIYKVTPVKALPIPNRFGTDAAYFVPAYNVTIVNFWSQFLNAISRDDAMLHKMGDAGIALEDTVVNVNALDGWSAYLDSIDVIVLQSAVDWPAARTVMRRWFVDNTWKPLNPQPDTYTAYKMGMTTVRNTFAARKAAGKTKPVPFFLSAPPKSASCQSANTVIAAAQVNQLMTTERSAAQFLPIQQQLFQALPFSFLSITELSMYRPDAYMSSGDSGFGHDCLHFCLPGVPDNWVDVFYNSFEQTVLP